MSRAIAVLCVGLGLASAAAARDPGEPHGPAGQAAGRVELEVEYPPDGAVVNGTACGVFVAGRAVAVAGESARLDVVIVLDTSLSTIDPSGADIDGDGVVGRPLTGRSRPDSEEGSSDAGDSVLAAEVAAAVELVRDFQFASLGDVSLRNTTTGDQARPFRLAADGSWIGFLKLDPGHSRIEAAARSESGASALQTLEVRLDPDMPPPALLPMYVIQRNELLEVCLADQRRLRMSLEKRPRPLGESCPAWAGFSSAPSRSAAWICRSLAFDASTGCRLKARRPPGRQSRPDLHLDALGQVDRLRLRCPESRLRRMPRDRRSPVGPTRSISRNGSTPMCISLVLKARPSPADDTEATRGPGRAKEIERRALRQLPDPFLKPSHPRPAPRAAPTPGHRRLDPPEVAAATSLPALKARSP